MGAVIGLAFRALIVSLGRLFLSWKTFSAFLITGILAVVLYNVVSEILGEIMDFALSKISEVSTSGISGVALELTSLGGWCAECCRLDDQVAIAITFISTKWLIVKVPFLKW